MSRFKRVTGLWATRKGSGLTGRLREAFTIPADGRLLVQEVRETDRKPNGPTHELVLVVDEERTFGERRDAPEGRVTPAAVDRAIEMQRPAGASPTPRQARRRPPIPADERDQCPNDDLPW